MTSPIAAAAPAAATRAHVRYRLRPLDAVHIGRRGVGLEATDGVFHSDALFNALCYAALDAGGEDGLYRFLAPFLAGEPPFLIGSTLPLFRRRCAALVSAPLCGAGARDCAGSWVR